MNEDVILHMKKLFQSHIDPVSGRMSLNRWKLVYSRMMNSSSYLPNTPEEIFTLLDTNGDGYITLEDFLRGFNSVCNETHDSDSSSYSDSPFLSQRHHFVNNNNNKETGQNFETTTTTTEGGTTALARDDLAVYFNEQMQSTIFRIYESLIDWDDDLVSVFEELVRDICRMLTYERMELSRLEKALKYKDEIHERQLLQYEEDLKIQLEKVESAAQKREKLKYEAELRVLLDREKENCQRWINDFIEMHRDQEATLLSLNRQQSETIQQLQDELSNRQDRCDHLSKRLDASQSELRDLKIDFNKSLTRLQEYDRLLTRRSTQLEECSKENEILRHQLVVVERVNKSLRQSREHLYEADVCRGLSSHILTDSGNGHDSHHLHDDGIEQFMENSANSTLHDVAELDSENSFASSLPFEDSVRYSVANKVTQEIQGGGCCSSEDTLIDKNRNSTQAEYSFQPFASMKRMTGQVFQLVMAGDSGVGKTSFITRLSRNEFLVNTLATLSVDFYNVQCEVNGRPVYLQVWDTAGQERFRSLAKSYFRKADGVILLYDCVCESSFLSVREWIEVIKEHCSAHVPVMIVGNKVDMRSQYKAQHRRVISTLDGLKIAQELDTLFIEASVKDNTNIHEAAFHLAKRLQSNSMGLGPNGSHEAFTLKDGTPLNPLEENRCCTI